MTLYVFQWSLSVTFHSYFPHFFDMLAWQFLIFLYHISSVDHLSRYYSWLLLIFTNPYLVPRAVMNFHSGFYSFRYHTSSFFVSIFILFIWYDNFLQNIHSLFVVRMQCKTNYIIPLNSSSRKGPSKQEQDNVGENLIINWRKSFR